MEKTENKYFTPDIEDLCIGYECEYNFAKAYTDEFNFVKIGYKDNEGYTNELSDMIHLIDDGAAEIRVPYLTKEQIEAEGWEHDEKYNDIKHFYKNEIYLRLYIGYHYDEVIFHNISIFSDGGILFRGECKDINTFRKICKLLGI